MKIAVNGKALATAERTGVARVALSLIENLAALRQDFSFDLFVPSPKSANPAWGLPENVRICPANFSCNKNSFMRSWWEQVFLARAIRRRGEYDVVLNLTNSAPVLLPLPLPQILLVHDVGFRNAQWFSKNFARYLTWVVQRAAQQGARFVTVSQNSAQQLAAMLPAAAPVLVVPNDSDAPPENLPAPQQEGRYGLFIGSLNPRKNIAGAIGGFQKFCAAFPGEMRLIIVGGENSLFAALPPALRHFPNVVFKGFVDDREKWALLKSAEFLLLPSFLEGFGLPILEALKVGTPVVASDIPVFRELFEDAVEYVDPYSEADIGRGIRDVVVNRARSAALKAQGLKIAPRFSWKAAAEKYVQLIEEVCAVHKPHGRTLAAKKSL